MYNHKNKSYNVLILHLLGFLIKYNPNYLKLSVDNPSIPLSITKSNTLKCGFFPDDTKTATIAPFDR